MIDLLEELVEMQRQGQRAVVATVIEASGSTPRKRGARMIIRPDGSISGTVGGGALEHKVMAIAPEVLAAREPRLVNFNLEKDLGMSCGGRTQVFFEPVGVDDRLVIFGAGHIGAELCAMAARCGFAVVVCDGRPELLTAERFPDAVRLLPSMAPEVLEDLDLAQSAPSTYAVVVTHGHSLDFALVTALAPYTDLAFLGMVGSKRKRIKLDEQLTEAGIDEAGRQRVQSPVGLNLGGYAPSEIAVSIVAQLIQVRSAHRAAAEAATETTVS